jgi:aspartyl-tRNA(Asn)/glutamyl-tRNA(Gln) amidotransferase subunit A
MARNPADAALLLQVIAGVDPNDPATEDVPLGDVKAALARGLDGVMVGRCPDLHQVQLADDVQVVFERAVAKVTDLAGPVRVVELPEASSAYDTFGATQRAEALHTHIQAGLYPERAAEYGHDVHARLEKASTENVGDYLRAQSERQRLRAGFARVFGEVDVLLTPTSAGSPVPIGEESLEHGGRTIEFRELVMTYTVPQDLVGLPTCVVRAGFDSLGVPVGVQFTGPPWADANVLGAAHAFWSATHEIQERWPNVPELDAGHMPPPPPHDVITSAPTERRSQ